MINIGICDDDNNIRLEIKEKCKSILGKKGLEYEIKEYISGKDYYETMKKTDILFLDLEMPVMSGIELKQRMIYSKTYIIFVTSHDELMEDSFGEHVVGFLRKPIKEIRFHSVFLSAIEKMRQAKLIKLGNGKVISSSDVCYIMAKSNYTYIFNNQGKEYVLRKTLGELEEMLEDCDFLRTHSSYLVNMHYIDEIVNDTVKIGTERIKLSARKKKKSLEKYNEFSKRMATY